MYCIPSSMRKLATGLSSVLLASFLSLGTIHSVLAAAPAQDPIFLTAPVKPMVMLNMSNDHQLFFKAYDDYSDITDSRPTINGVANPNYGSEKTDGNPDTTYVHAYDYYGYFDSQKCYDYQGGIFEPTGPAAGKYCTGKWSGNFLNWATMTRIDTVRKILYGGYRHVDTATETVLERAPLPNDAHSFTKYYNGTDINQLTPFNPTSGAVDTAATGVTICNTTTSGSGDSQTVTAAPQLMIAQGNYSLWASNERWQCRWNTASNGNNSELTGMYAYADSPADSEKLGDFSVRVKACVSDMLEENCVAYGANHKPGGLLQEFGEDDSMLFGLITGSYGKNKSGGVLRKNISYITDEIKTDGTFKVPSNGNSIVKTLDLLRIYGYDYGGGTYHEGGVNDNCSWALSSFADGHCSNWGNPQAEIYLESLRYLAGLEATASFSPATADSTRITGLNQAKWEKPLGSENYCAPLSVIQFNASTTSYDGDVVGLSGATEIGLSGTNTLSSATKHVGDKEGIHGNKFFIGENGTDNNQLCTAKTVSDLSTVRGTCPDAPRLQGSYQIAGLAHHARRNGITVDGLNDPKKVVTYGIALAAAVPKVSINIPGKTGQITILPACRNNLLNANCAIVDFKVIKQEQEIIEGETVNTGSLYVNWEDSEQGGDYDQDMWGIIKYAVSGSQVAITTRVIAQSTGDAMGFGYVINGTSDDGFKVHSGVNGFQYGTYCTNVDDSRCTCRISGTAGVCDSPQSGARTVTYAVGSSDAKTLETPLYYAAKWGGYSRDEEKLAVEKDQDLDALVLARDTSKSYFYSTSPRHLENSLRKLFIEAKKGLGVASSAATNSTRLNDGSRFYQALFSSDDWTGELKALGIADKTLGAIPGATTNTQFETTASIDGGRNVITYDRVTATTVDFKWSSLNATQKALIEDGEGGDIANIGENRVNWIRGSRVNENANGGMRVRNKLLGDIVNSNPVYSGNATPRNTHLSEGGSSYQAYAKTKAKILYVGANDGMLHAFNATTFQEVFAFVPNGVYSKLAKLTRRNYGGNDNPHQYLVDGSLYVTDVYLNGAWKTILVGSLGAGGRGVFGLDVTNPSTPSVLFEFNEADFPALGYVLGSPLIAPLANGKWVAVFGNGYGVGATSQLFMVDLAAPNGSGTKMINTGAGTGLSTPSLLPNLTSQVEYAYAGDLQGNIWKFNLVSESVVYNAPLFVAKDQSGVRQPITGGITLGANTQLASAIMVYFGTGKYFDHGDNSTAPSPQHSFYAIADQGAPLGAARSGILHTKSISDSGSKRTIQGETLMSDGMLVSAVDWAEKKGWYFDFNTIAGERVTTKPILTLDRLIFNTIIPSAIPCAYGGRSYAMEVIAVGDKKLKHSVLGDNANTELDNMVISEPSILAGETNGVKLDCNVEGTCQISETEYWSNWRGRMNWREFH